MSAAPLGDENFEYTHRQFLLMRTLAKGGNWDAALEAADQAAHNHPEWDMNEMKTYDEWLEGREW